MNPEPAKDYSLLLQQFKSMVFLYNALEKRYLELSRKDYLLQEARLNELQIALDSEKEMNSILTKELYNDNINKT